MEVFKDIQNYEGLYQISSYGRVFSIKHKKFLILRKNNKGYLQVQLYNQGRKVYKVHRLVADAFIENKNNLPQVNHLDGNKNNNHVDNLEWCNNHDNLIHSWNIGLRRCKEFENYCLFCGKKLIRNRFKSGRLEDFGAFKKRKYCNINCARKGRYEKSKRF